VAADDGELGLIRRHGDLADEKAGQQELHANRESGERGADKAPSRNNRRTTLGAPNHFDPGGPRRLELRATTI
jgi:hypothetical protein